MRETNRYAAHCLEGTSWVTTVEAYFVFYIYMGLVRIRDYWSTDDVFHYAPIASRISWHRFEEMSRYLYFVNNRELPPRGSPTYHRLQCVKPVVDALRGRCSAVYHVWKKLWSHSRVSKTFVETVPPSEASKERYKGLGGGGEQHRIPAGVCGKGRRQG